MPFYEYQCSACNHELEALQKINDAPLRKCPACGRNTLRKLVSAPIFRLKGAGWYETDFKSDKEDKRNIAGEKEPDKAAETKGADTKSDAKAADKSDAKSDTADNKGSDSKGAKDAAAKDGGSKDGSKTAPAKATAARATVSKPRASARRGASARHRARR
jgi:putative FmdB family regulatory protein